MQNITFTNAIKRLADAALLNSWHRNARKKAVERFRRRRAGWRRVEVSTADVPTWRHEGHRY